MTIDTWWPRLSAGTRDRLMANNGSPVPPAVVEQIEMAGEPTRSDPWWTHEDDSSEVLLPDAATDWIEEIANGESPAIARFSHPRSSQGFYPILWQARFW